MRKPGAAIQYFACVAYMDEPPRGVETDRQGMAVQDKRYHAMSLSTGSWDYDKAGTLQTLPILAASGAADNQPVVRCQTG